LAELPSNATLDTDSSDEVSPWSLIMHQTDDSIVSPARFTLSLIPTVPHTSTCLLVNIAREPSIATCTSYTSQTTTVARKIYRRPVLLGDCSIGTQSLQLICSSTFLTSSTSTDCRGQKVTAPGRAVAACAELLTLHIGGEDGGSKVHQGTASEAQRITAGAET